MRTLKLGGSDMVVGVDWLKKYSPVVFDFNFLFIQFSKDGQTVTLNSNDYEGELSLLRESKARKWFRKHIYGVIGCICASSEGQQGEEEPIPGEVLDLLIEFEDVFAEPKGLPPPRSQNHQIVLQEGARPFKLRPYRILYIQKAEMERLVKEMLENEIIQASNSPFASPILLFKKKDGSWRFCVDYR